MKKFIVCLILLGVMLPADAAFWNRKQKAIEAEYEGKGYAGTLPKINTGSKETKIQETTPIFEAQPSFNDPAELKPVPRDNPAFVDIIQKQDKTSQFVIDANEIISMMEKLVECIEDNGSVQLFVTRANVLSLNADNLTAKYEGKPESYYASFKKVQEVSSYAKTVAQLRKEAAVYRRYLAYTESGSIYNPENISMQLQYLLEELNTAILLLKEES